MGLTPGAAPPGAGGGWGWSPPATRLGWPRGSWACPGAAPPEAGGGWGRSPPATRLGWPRDERHPGGCALSRWVGAADGLHSPPDLAGRKVGLTPGAAPPSPPATRLGWPRDERHPGGCARSKGGPHTWGCVPAGGWGLGTVPATRLGWPTGSVAPKGGRSEGGRSRSRVRREGDVSGGVRPQRLARQRRYLPGRPIPRRSEDGHPPTRPRPTTQPKALRAPPHATRTGRRRHNAPPPVSYS